MVATTLVVKYGDFIEKSQISYSINMYSKVAKILVLKMKYNQYGSWFIVSRIIILSGVQTATY